MISIHKKCHSLDCEVFVYFSEHSFQFTNMPKNVARKIIYLNILLNIITKRKTITEKAQECTGVCVIQWQE